MIQIDPNYGRAYQEIGHTNILLKNKNKALKAYEKNLGEGESDTLDTMLKLSQIHLSLGELKEWQEFTMT